MSDFQRYQTLLNKLQSASSQEEREWLTMEFALFQLPEKLCAAVWSAAVLRFFDIAYLNAVLDTPLTVDEYQQITSLSFVEPYPSQGFFNIHERTRNLLLSKLWQENTARYREISRRAVIYCLCQNQNDVSWQIETIYHQLLAEPSVGSNTLYETAKYWYNPPQFAYNKIETLIRTVREHFNAGRLDVLSINKFLYWDAVLDIEYCRYSSAQNKLQQINLPDNTPVLSKANYLWRLAAVSRYLAAFIDARSYYEQALVLYQYLEHKIGETNCLRGLGNVYFDLMELSKARDYYNQALLVHQQSGIGKVGNANCHYELGNVYLCLTEFTSAHTYYQEAINLCNQLGAKRRILANSLRGLGDTYLQCGKLAEAQANYEQSITLYRNLEYIFGEADCLKSFGLLYIKTNDYVTAQEFYERASTLFEQMGYKKGVIECLEGFATLYEAQGDISRSQATWLQASILYDELKIPKRAEKCRMNIRS